MSTRFAFVSFVLAAAHEAAAFVALGRSRVGPFLPSGGNFGPRAARSRVLMTSTAPPQPERSTINWGDFDSWFWGDPHVRGGVEHAVFKQSDSAVVLFDGECNFCNSGIWLILGNSDDRNMRFCAQNTDMGHSLLASFGQDQERLSSIALLDKAGHLHTHSDAVIQILFRMEMPYPALGYALSCVPLGLRDTLYAWVSHHRHEFLPESVTCRFPEDNEMSRFVM